jgi:aminobenzoyl-glutamate utilization protein B
MLVAAKTLGLAGIELLKKPELVAKAKEVFEKQTKNNPYASPLPPGAKPKA